MNYPYSRMTIKKKFYMKSKTNSFKFYNVYKKAKYYILEILLCLIKINL